MTTDQQSDRELYLRENAVAEVNQRDRRIERLRAEVTRLHKRDRSHKELIAKLRKRLADAGLAVD